MQGDGATGASPFVWSRLGPRDEHPIDGSSNHFAVAQIPIILVFALAPTAKGRPFKIPNGVAKLDIVLEFLQEFGGEQRDGLLSGISGFTVLVDDVGIAKPAALANRNSPHRFSVEPTPDVDVAIVDLAVADRGSMLVRLVVAHLLTHGGLSRPSFSSEDLGLVVSNTLLEKNEGQ